jgi:hypothetical protein
MKTKTGIILLGQGEGIMKTKARIILLGLVMVIALCYVNFARADSRFVTGGAAQSGGLGAPVNLEFQIVIPSFIYFRVGSIGSVNTIQFSPTHDEVVNQTLGISATAASGDMGNGIVTVSLISNAGLAGSGVNITQTNNGPTGLDDGAGNTISYAQINTATDNLSLPAPVLSNGGPNTVNIANTSGVITNEQAHWTYTYDNDNPGGIPAAGTYGGAGNGGLVTYTAAVP